jgi:hypothetical protein
LTAIGFIAWFHRAYVNLTRLGARGLRASSGWAIGVWFIPILNLIRPKQLMDDIWRASDAALPVAEAHGWQTAPVPGLLSAWWAFFLLSSFVSNISGRMLSSAETLDARASAGTVSMLADGGVIVAAVVAILVVRAVTSRQEERAERLRWGGPPAQATYAAPPVLDANASSSFPPPMAAQ